VLAAVPQILLGSQAETTLQVVPNRKAYSTLPAPPVPLDQVKLIRDMEAASRTLPEKNPRQRAQTYKDLAKTLLLWAKPWKRAQLPVPPICHKVMELVFQDIGRRDEAGFLARSMIRMACYYRMYPGGSKERLHQYLVDHENCRLFLGLQCRVDDLRLELESQLSFPG
jgi:hypothetical protein